MAEVTSIEWCDATLNLWWGCTKVSDGCKFCYAEQLSDQRYKKGAWGPKGVRTEVKSWRSTLNKISKRAKEEGRRLRVFCQSMSDTFEGTETCGDANFEVISRLREDLGKAILNHPELDFLLLTKRPENVLKYGPLGYLWTREGIPDNVWVGTSVEDQETADKRIPELLKIPAKVRFLSCEPLLGPVDLQYPTFNGADSIESLEGIRWVICGGESGLNARPMHPDWARSLRNQCDCAKVPFFFKQWGEWLPWSQFGDADIPDSCEQTRYETVEFQCGKFENIGRPIWCDDIDDNLTLGRVGKKAAGRVLDGRTWSEFPEALS